MGKRWPPNSDVQINSFWEWAVRHMEERPRISGTIIQKVAVIKTYNECPKLKKTLKREGKIIISMMKEGYKLASEFKKLSKIQLRDKVRYITDQNRNVTNRNIFYYCSIFMKTETLRLENY